MTEGFINTLKRIVDFNDEEIDAILNISKEDRISKGEFYARPDRLCQTISFLNSGILRVYHLHDGKEITDYFNTTHRNNFVSSFGGFLSQQRTETYVEALTDCELLTVTYDDLHQLYDRYKSFERMGRLLAEKNYLLALERIESLQYHDATARYLSFLELYPNLINEISNHYVASYLGVTPESLSRIRKSLVR